MPSSHTVWLVSSPLSPSADAGEMLADLEGKLDPSLLEAGFSSREGMKNAALKAVSGKGVGSVSRVDWGEFKVREPRLKGRIPFEDQGADMWKCYHLNTMHCHDRREPSPRCSPSQTPSQSMTPCLGQLPTRWSVSDSAAMRTVGSSV